MTSRFSRIQGMLFGKKRILFPFPTCSSGGGRGKGVASAKQEEGGCAVAVMEEGEEGVTSLLVSLAARWNDASFPHHNYEGSSLGR